MTTRFAEDDLEMIDPDEDNWTIQDPDTINQNLAALNDDPELSLLNETHGLLVKQKPPKWYLDFCCGDDSSMDKRFKVYDMDTGRKRFICEEKSGWIARNVLGNMRPYSARLLTYPDEFELVVLEKPLHLRTGGLFCCWAGSFFYQMVHVFAGDSTASPDYHMGYVKEDFALGATSIGVYLPHGTEVFRVVGRCWQPFLCCNYSYDIYRTGSSESCGFITKSLLEERVDLFNHSDNFYMDLPEDATASERALLFGAMWLINHLFYEDNQR